MLSQQTADYLIAVEKIKADNDVYSLPTLGGVISVPLETRDGREKFLLDVTRQRLNLKKSTFQNRYNVSYPLIRLDIGGAPHRNPDREEVPCPHIHYYREGFGDKWAKPVPDGIIVEGDLMKTLENFLKHCSVVETPNFVEGLNNEV